MRLLEKNLVFNIQKYSLHDGDGIRTIVFFKGCPLRCPWCSNPESQSFHKEIFRKESLCIQCVSSDPFKCPASPDKCPTGALEVIGKEMTIKELIEEVKKDMVFYDSSSGGVTVSGGEPLAQGKFLIDFLKRLKELGIHTAIETTGFSSWEILDKASDYLDLVLFDLKLMDEREALEVVGADINVILRNFKRLVEKNINRIIPRVPLIPNYTMKIENIKKITDFVVSQNLEEIHILPFHQLGSSKYKSLGKEYELKDLKPPTDGEVEKIKDYMVKKGLKVNIGGK